MQKVKHDFQKANKQETKKYRQVQANMVQNCFTIKS